MEKDEVLLVHSILHLIFHRNKNQHGRTKWWKWLSILKRTVWSLALSLDSSATAGGSQGGKSGKSSAEFYKRYLTDRVVPRCYLAFSVAVADSQFSTLGTVLLATLARLSKVTGVDKELKRGRTEEVSSSNRSFRLEASKGTEKEDLGEVFARDTEVSDAVPSSVSRSTPASALRRSRETISSKSSAAEDVDTSKAKKKKKKKRNAIDDLFDGLL